MSIIIKKELYLMDLQNENEAQEVTIEYAREFLGDLWYDEEEPTSKGFDSETDFDNFLESIPTMSLKQLNEHLMGCDYVVLTHKELKELDEPVQIVDCVKA